MYNEKTKKYIKDVNDSYQKIVESEILDGSNKKKESERISEAYKKMINEEHIDEAVLKGNQLWMANVQLTKSGKGQMARNKMKKWAEANKIPFIWDLDPQRVAIDKQVFDKLRDEFPDYVQASAGKNIYIKNPKTGELKKTKIA